MYIGFYIYFIAWKRPLVSCRLYRTFITQRKKDLREIEKIEKYSQKNIYVRIAYNSLCVCVCVCVCVLCRLYLRIVCGRQCDC